MFYTQGTDNGVIDIRSPVLNAWHDCFAEDALTSVKLEEIRKKGKVPKNAGIFFTIFQTFMSGPPKDG